MAPLSTKVKDKCLSDMALKIRAQKDTIIKENEKDIKAAKEKKLQTHLVDRLLLNDKRIEEMAKGLEEIVSLPDPVGRVASEWERPNHLSVKKVRIPLGVIGVIYESRPNVTVDAAALCFKAGNAILLRGGSEAFHSNMCLGKILQDVLKENSVPPEAITVIPSTDRKLMQEMLKLNEYIDLIIPRGGEGLMKFVSEHSKVPVVKHDKGVCNVYVDDEADLEMALSIVENAKVQRPGVCNAAENLFVHQKIAPQFLPQMAERLKAKGVELRGDDRTREILPDINKATSKDFDTEYLDLILSIKLVGSLEEAIEACQKYGSLHTEAIVTKNKESAEFFVKNLDSSCVLVNASTRFNDGGQLGLGAEIGISTTKLHAFGPMGLEELTTTKFVVHGDGQVRE